ncbi:hypothetical protein CEXT_90201 [Caerostris extrusa]|uniref:Uncharacterized protein n=1 Tax=Caerostris extrusa TaxID=172846 RepID=A0AAV4NGP1_CAEEX|nr:hypothetical protein CEXT_90201 [Caerostris extrusa]
MIGRTKTAKNIPLFAKVYAWEEDCVFLFRYHSLLLFHLQTVGIFLAVSSWLYLLRLTGKRPPRKSGGGKKYDIIAFLNKSTHYF